MRGQHRAERMNGGTGIDKLGVHLGRLYISMRYDKLTTRMVVFVAGGLRRNTCEI